MIRSIAILLIGVTPAALPSQNYDPAVAALREEWGMNINSIRNSAEQMPDADFAYRPVATVRTFAQLIGHIVDSQALLCAAALGEKVASVASVEETVTTKVELLKKLRESIDYCGKAYLQNIAALPQRGEQTQRYSALVHNTAHVGEHYGNIVTYMRMKGLVPCNALAC